MSNTVEKAYDSFFGIWENVDGFFGEGIENANNFVETIQDSDFMNLISDGIIKIGDKFNEMTDFNNDGKSDLIEWGKDFLSNEIGMYLNLDQNGVDKVREGLDWIEDKAKDLGNLLKDNINEELDYNKDGTFDLSEDLKSYLKDSDFIGKFDEIENYISSGDAWKDFQEIVANIKEDVLESDIAKEFASIFDKDKDFDKLFDKDNVKEFIQDVSDVAKDVAESAKEVANKVKEDEFDL